MFFEQKSLLRYTHKLSRMNDRKSKNLEHEVDKKIADITVGMLWYNVSLVVSLRIQ